MNKFTATLFTRAQATPGTRLKSPTFLLLSFLRNLNSWLGCLCLHRQLSQKANIASTMGKELSNTLEHINALYAVRGRRPTLNCCEERSVSAESSCFPCLLRFKKEPRPQRARERFVIFVENPRWRTRRAGMGCRKSVL